MGNAMQMKRRSVTCRTTLAQMSKSKPGQMTKAIGFILGSNKDSVQSSGEERPAKQSPLGS
eukprot:11068094-Alexandrium_andersonii.AAC.1